MLSFSHWQVSIIQGRLLVNHVWLCILDTGCLRSLFLMLNRTFLKMHPSHIQYMLSRGIWAQPMILWMRLQLCSQMYAGSTAQEERQRNLFYSALSLCWCGAGIQQGDSFWLNKYAACMNRLTKNGNEVLERSHTIHRDSCRLFLVGPVMSGISLTFELFPHKQ